MGDFSKEICLTTPLREDNADLVVEDLVHLSGTVFIVRDLANMRIMEHLGEGKQLSENFYGACARIQFLNEFEGFPKALLGLKGHV